MGNAFSYEGKRVVVTGGFSGVGAALIDDLKELGAEHVTVLDLKAPSGPHDVFLETNLSDKSAVDAAIAAIDGRVDVLFNNAGVAATQPPLTVLSVNYLALRRLSEGLLGQIPSGGAIVNTASIAGSGWPNHVTDIDELLAISDWDESLAWLEAHPELLADPYGFSKEVVQRYTMRSSRTTIAAGVRTNSVCPCPIETPLMVDFRATMGDAIIDWNVSQLGTGRIATPEDISPPLAFLGSDASAFVNGVNLIADGGFTSAMATGQVDFSALA